MRARRVVENVALALTVSLVTWPLVAPSNRASAADPDAVVEANPVRLRMASTDSIGPNSFTALLDAMYGSPATALFSNARLGSGLARERMITALSDGKLSGPEERFIISGSPFTKDETAALTSAKATLLRAPVHATHNAIIASYTFGTAHVVDDPLFPEPGPPLSLDGPHPSVNASMMKMPWSAVGSHFFELFPGESWSNPDVLTAWGLKLDPADHKWHVGDTNFYFDTFGGQVPMFTARYEPSAANLYLLTALSKTAPDQWAAYVAQTKVTEPGESFVGGHTNTIRARGVGNLLQYLADQLTATNNSKSGTMGPAPLWAVPQLFSIYPNFAGTLWVTELQNGAKEWVAPTSETVTKAVAAGGDTPLYALDHPVPGAYPLSWVDSLYVPATGLTIDEVNAVSAFIRFLVTDGQDIVKADNDGVLGADLVTKALDAANTAVTSNCLAAKGVVRSQADSPYYPLAATAPKLHGLGPQLVCATPIDPATTSTSSSTSSTTQATSSTTQATTTTTQATTTARATTTTARAATTRATVATDTAPTATTTVAPTTTAPPPSTARPTTTTTVALPSDQVIGAPLSPTLAALPMGLPSTGRNGFDRWTTMLLGGLVAFRVRRLFQRRATA